MIVLNENIKGLKVGTKMIGNWGAMIPLSYGTVTDVIRDYKGVDVEVTIEWDDLKEATYWTKDINKGPGIGINQKRIGIQRRTYHNEIYRIKINI